MAADNAIGQTAKATWTADGGGSETDLKNEKWTFTPSKKVTEANNTTDGRNRISGLDDAKATCEGPLDMTVIITDTIKPGDTGILKLYLESGGPFASFHAIVGEEMSIETEFDEPIGWKCDFMLKSGSVTWFVSA